MSTELKFYEGLRGSGVVIALICGQDRLVFDFGAPFTPLAQIEDGVILPRKKAAVQDALALGKLPPVEGVFSREALGDLPLLSAEESPWNTAVLISHLHLDHMSGIGMVAPSIPVYLSEEAWKLENALRQIGEKVGDRAFQFHRLHEPFLVGKIKVTAYFSDHPCAGSCGYLIETEDKTIFYSGDIRFHGVQRERAWQEIEALAQKKIDLLILDSTTTSPKQFARKEAQENALFLPSRTLLEEEISEEAIYESVRQRLQANPQLAFFNLYHRDMQLIENLIRLAAEQGRTPVFEPETAWIIR